MLRKSNCLILLAISSVLIGSTMGVVLKPATTCTYYDFSYVNMTLDMTTPDTPQSVISIRQPLHTNQAIDLVDFYLGYVNKGYTAVDTTCFNFDYSGDASNSGFKIDGFLKFTVSSLSIYSFGMFSYGYNDPVYNNKPFPTNTYIYLPYVKSVPAGTNKTFINITGTGNMGYAALLKSSLNVDNGGNAYGHYITQDANSMTFILRQVYYLPNDAIATATPTADSSCPVATFNGGDAILRQCGLRYGALRAPLDSMDYPTSPTVSSPI